MEDDGVGPAHSSANGRAHALAGMGLPNVAERLRTLYPDRAALCFETRPACGSQALA